MPRNILKFPTTTQRFENGVLVGTDDNTGTLTLDQAKTLQKNLARTVGYNKIEAVLGDEDDQFLLDIIVKYANLKVLSGGTLNAGEQSIVNDTFTDFAPIKALYLATKSIIAEINAASTVAAVFAIDVENHLDWP